MTVTGHRTIPPPGEHGGDGAALAEALGIAVDDVIDLSASLNPLAPDPVDIVSPHLGALRRYPDSSAAARRLAEAIGVDADQLVLTNGAAEAITLIASVERVGSLDRPEFSLYERHLARLQPDAPRWRSNPNNPLGTLAAPDDTARVWDEAFYPLATGTWTRGDESAWRVGSLTKLWSCPGLRLGYVIAPDSQTAGEIRRRQSAWAVNGLAAASLGSFLDRTNLAVWAQEIAELRSQLVTTLRERDLDVQDTDANWVLVRAPGLRDALASHCVLVRDCASFGMPGTSRIAVPRPRDVTRLRSALDVAVVQAAT